MKLCSHPLGSVRLAESQDVPFLAQIATRSDSDGWTELEIQSAFCPNRDVWVWVCSGRDEIAGFAVFQSVLDEAELLYMLVDRHAQKQGIGQYLLQQSFQRLRARGVGRCFLEVRQHNLSAQRLYRRLGFSIVGQRKAYYPASQTSVSADREDALLMCCDFPKE